MTNYSKNKTGATVKINSVASPLWLKLKILLMVSCILLLIIVAQPVVKKLTMALDQPIKLVNVDGDFTNIDAEYVKALIEQQMSDGIVQTDLKQIRELLLAQPWVQRASIRRKWPDTLNVWIVENTPVAKFNNSLLSAESKIFTPTDDINKFVLPQLTGSAAGAEIIWKQYQLLTQLLQQEGLNIITLNRADRGSWDFTLTENNNLQIYLGRNGVEKQIERFLILYRHVLKANFAEIEHVDLRYTHGIAVHWKPSETQNKNT